MFSLLKRCRTRLSGSRGDELLREQDQRSSDFEAVGVDSFNVQDDDILNIWCLRKKLRENNQDVAFVERERGELLVLAEEFYVKERKQLLKRVDSAHKVVSLNKTELYQLVGFYIVFQGVIFAASVQTNRLDCSSWWIPFLLSLLASLVIVFGICLKFFDLQREAAHHFLLQARHEVSFSTVYLHLVILAILWFCQCF
jgi:hypothetical protein